MPVTPRHGRCVRLSGGEKRRLKHAVVMPRVAEAAAQRRRDARARVAGDGSAPAMSIVRTAKEKQAVRAQRAIARERSIFRNLKKLAKEIFS